MSAVPPGDHGDAAGDAAASRGKEIFTVEADDAGARLDTYLASQRSGISRTAIQGRIRGGLVWVDGDLIAKCSHRLSEGDTVELLAPTERTDGAEIPSEDVPFDILHQDADIVVIGKPAGVVVHPGNGVRDRTLVGGLLYRFPDLREAFRDSVPDRPGIVHRLDRDTSGVMVVARTEAARQSLAHMFAERRMEKTYLACVHGVPPDVGELDAPLARRANDRKRFSSRTGKGRPSVTLFRTVGRTPRHALLQVHPRTGRTHQIRVHLADAGWPIVGDRWYGRKQDTHDGLMLHAWKLAFTHPSSGVEVSFTAPVPPPFRAYIQETFDAETVARIES